MTADAPTPDRFSEAHALEVLTEGATPLLERGVQVLRQALKTLPACPGVYRMLNESGDALYVGKARNLKARVSNYIQIAALPQRLRRMVAQTHSLIIVTTHTEAEALLLEASLIKRHRPPFNILLRDSKTLPYLFLREDHPSAQLVKHRGARTGVGHYYGPFAHSGALNHTINSLQKLFLLRSCSDSMFANRSRPCLLYQIKRCAAPCVGRVSAQEYDQLVDDAKAFLSGRSQAVQARLVARMQAASDALDYETAAVLRDRVQALTALQAEQTVHVTSAGDADVLAVAQKSGIVCVQMFFLRHGQNWGASAHFPRHDKEESLEDVLSAFITQFYTQESPPPRLLLNHMPSGAALIAQALSGLGVGRVRLEMPARGPLKALVDSAARNAGEALDRRLAEQASEGRHRLALAELFELSGPPQRIDVYDNSHIQGRHAVGAMIVAGPEGLRKNAYRRFNFRDTQASPGDDFAMMHEMLARRFARLQAQDPDRTSGDWPDLTLIDGGKGQLSVVMAALDSVGVADVAVVAVSKGPDRHAGREVFHLPDGREIRLPLNDPTLFFLQRLRDEAHRFAIGAHRQKRRTEAGRSPLDEIEGIGPTRKKALLLHFGSAKGVSRAGVADLAKVSGISTALAQMIYDHFHNG